MFFKKIVGFNSFVAVLVNRNKAKAVKSKRIQDDQNFLTGCNNWNSVSEFIFIEYRYIKYGGTDMVSFTLHFVVGIDDLLIRLGQEKFWIAIYSPVWRL